MAYLKKEKLWTRDYCLLLITALGAGFLYSFFTSTLPIYAERITGSAALAGMVTGIYSFTALLTRPVAGIACERLNKIKMLVIGISMMTVICFLYNWANTIVILLVLRAFHGIGFGIKSTVSGVVVAEVIPESRFAEGISIYGLYLPITNAIGPAAALAIIGNGGLENFRDLFILATGLGIISIILTANIKGSQANGHPPEMKSDLYQQQNKMERQKQEKSLPKTFYGFEAGVLFPSVVLVLVYIGQGSVISFIPMYCMDRGWGSCGSFFIINAGALFLSRLVFAKTILKIDYDKIMIFAVIVFGLALFAIPYAVNILHIYGIAAALGFSVGIVPMAVNILVLERCSPQRKGTAIAAYTAAMDIGVGAGSVLLGLVLDYSGYGTTYLCAAGLTFISAIIYIRTLWGGKKEIHFE